MSMNTLEKKVAYELKRGRVIKKQLLPNNLMDKIKVAEETPDTLTFILKGKPHDIFNMSVLDSRCKLFGDKEIYFFINNDKTYTLAEFSVEENKCIKRRKFAIGEICRHFSTLYLLINSKET